MITKALILAMAIVLSMPSFANPSCGKAYERFAQEVSGRLVRIREKGRFGLGGRETVGWVTDATRGPLTDEQVYKEQKMALKYSGSDTKPYLKTMRRERAATEGLEVLPIGAHSSNETVVIEGDKIKSIEDLGPRAIGSVASSRKRGNGLDESILTQARERMTPEEARDTDLKARLEKIKRGEPTKPLNLDNNGVPANRNVTQPKASTGDVDIDNLGQIPLGSTVTFGSLSGKQYPMLYLGRSPSEIVGVDPETGELKILNRSRVVDGDIRRTASADSTKYAKNVFRPIEDAQKLPNGSRLMVLDKKGRVTSFEYLGTTKRDRDLIVGKDPSGALVRFERSEIEAIIQAKKPRTRRPVWQDGDVVPQAGPHLTVEDMRAVPGSTTVDLVSAGGNLYRGLEYVSSNEDTLYAKVPGEPGVQKYYIDQFIGAVVRLKPTDRHEISPELARQISQQRLRPSE